MKEMKEGRHSLALPAPLPLPATRVLRTQYDNCHCSAPPSTGYFLSARVREDTPFFCFLLSPGQSFDSLYMLFRGGWLAVGMLFWGHWHLASPHATVSLRWSWPGWPLGTPFSQSGGMELFLETTSCLWQTSGEGGAGAGVCDCVVQACAGNGSSETRL